MHIPVMQKEVLEALYPVPEGLYLDGTVGLGGHSKLILQADPTCKVCGLDRDSNAIKIAQNILSPYEGRFKLFNFPFSKFESALKKLGWFSINGAFLDLGISSYQLDSWERGFSFRRDGPLDMRMGEGCIKSASDLVNTLSFEDLKYYISVYGEEIFAAKIAKAIISERSRAPIITTSRLASIVMQSYPAKWRKTARKHPATKTFQALRIIVNNELGELETFLATILPWLKSGGRLVIISFHSLEDRIVKIAMRKWAGKSCHNYGCGHTCLCLPKVRLLFKKPLTTSSMEARENPRSSSAKLRAIEKIN